MSRAGNAARAMGSGVRDQWTSILVAALGSAFGVVLLEASQVLSAVIAASGFGARDSVGLALALVAVVFVVIAVYVAAIVIGNTVATVIAGRTAQIALLRLIGATAGELRRAIARSGLLVGLVGAGIGLATGQLVTVAGVVVLRAAAVLPPGAGGAFSWWVCLPLAAVIAATWSATWAGSRRVLAVSPIQATGASVEGAMAEERAHRGRTIAAIGMMAVGFGLLAAGIAVGLVTQLGVLVGLVGGVVSFTGLVLGSHLFMPPVLRACGRMLGSSAAARLAAANAVRHPQRSARSTIGVVIGVTLITMFAVAVSSYRAMIITAAHASPEEYAGVTGMLETTVAVFSLMVGFSGVIAAIGLVNNLTVSVTQRKHELALLRALGLDRGQLRRMVLAEATAMTVSAVAVGILLGVFYGWAGAQSLLGSIKGSPGLVPPVVPWAIVAAAAAAAGVLALIASAAPGRRAARMSPIAVLQSE